MSLPVCSWCATNNPKCHWCLHTVSESDHGLRADPILVAKCEDEQMHRICYECYTCEKFREGDPC